MNSSHQFISDIPLQLQAINDAKRKYILEIKQQLAYNISQFAKNSKQAQNRTISDKIRNNIKPQVLRQQYRNKKSSQHQIFSNPCKQVFLLSKLSNGFLNIYSQSQKEEKNLRKQYKLLLERKSRLFKQNLNLDDSLYILRRQISVQKRKQTIVDKQKLITQQQSKCFDCKARLDQNFDSKENVLIFRIGKIQQNLREQENKLSMLVDERYKLCQQQQNSALNVAQKQKMLEQIRYCDQVSLRKYKQLKKRSNEIEQRLITAKNTNEELMSKFQRLSIKNYTYNNRLKPVFEIQTCRLQVIQQKLKGSCERLMEQRSKWLQSTIKSDDISIQNHQHDFNVGQLDQIDYGQHQFIRIGVIQQLIQMEEQTTKLVQEKFSVLYRIVRCLDCQYDKQPNNIVSIFHSISPINSQVINNIYLLSKKGYDPTNIAKQLQFIYGTHIIGNKRQIVFQTF